MDLVMGRKCHVLCALVRSRGAAATGTAADQRKVGGFKLVPSLSGVSDGGNCQFCRTVSWITAHFHLETWIPYEYCIDDMSQ